jgi:energy-coupling factor transporter transmembrane protein EcfT
LFFIYKRVKYFSIDWRKEKGRENINCFVCSCIFLIAKLAKTLAKIRQIFFFGFFGQLLALFLAKYISNSIDYVIITEE